MKSKALVCAIALSCLGLSSLSFARDDDRRGRGGDSQRFEQRGHQHPGARHAGPRQFDPRAARHQPQFDRRDVRNHRQFGARGAQFHRGERMPLQYRHRQHAMNNWQARHLHAPGRGQQWVQVGADYALIAIATGVIAQIVLSR